jgi:twitching motility protein PilT
MPARKYLHLLSREEIDAIELQVGKPPVAKVGGAPRRIQAVALAEPEIINVLAGVGGLPHLPSLADGRTWQHDASFGTVQVSAEYDHDVLRVTLRVTSRSVTTAPDAPQRVHARADTEPVGLPAAQPPVTPLAKVALVSAPQPDPPVPPRVEASPLPTTTEPAPVVITAHDAFNFEAANAWASRPPPPMAAKPKPVITYQGDALDDLFGLARNRAASDLHVLADRPPMLRLAGELVPQGDALPAERAEALILARVPAKLRATLDRDGSCDFAFVHPAYGRFRANVSRQRTGIKLTARLIGNQIPTLAELGLPESIARATHHHQGLIVVTGPTGHGKTTTLASIVGIINRESSHHVITVEDPIEYVHPIAKAVISQREVGTHTKSFQAALKGSLREDPDVIVVGELRDTETVRMALSASETGHLVISTMNTPSAAKAIERLIDLFPPGDQPQVRMTLAGGLRLIVSQRLLPTTDGTALCAAAEILPGNLPLWNLIRENRTYQIASLQQRGKALGITRLDESLAQLVRSGRTTLQHALAVAEQPEHLPALIAGKSPVLANAQAPQKAPGAQPQPQKPAAAAQRPGAAQPAARPAQQQPAKPEGLGKTVLSRAGRLFGSGSE